MSKNQPRTRPVPAVSPRPASPRLSRFAPSPPPAPGQKRSLKGWVWLVVSRIVLWFVISSVGSVVLMKWVPVLVTPTMLDRKISALATGTDSELHYDWTAYDDLSWQAPIAFVAAEDQRFPAHYGFDFEAMGQAFQYNMRGKRTKGASTISQQVAKNVFLWQGRSYFRKGLEAWFTLLIETIWGKKRILEVYLNVAETGPMTFGVEAASQRFYGHSAQILSRSEAARMAAVLPSPNRFLIARPSGYVQRRTAFISRQMRGLGRGYLAGL
ncbi:MAG: monofunctional biosynthetic peptidoglycan transglycosylase [Sphingobacteriaceae bacterium]|nr:monofunctional biosynthetic peptidoglycan transglycosylase [Cytophagaceae bacterium]